MLICVVRSELEHLALVVSGVEVHQSLDRILDLSQEDHSGNDVRLVGSLLVQRHQIAVEHGVVNFALGAGQTGDVGGQAVQVQSLAVLRQLHHLFGAGPVLMLGVLRQELLLTEQYLYIQNLRYMDFVDYEIIYEPSWEDHGAEIPKLTIQPVVENIFVHGLTSQICHIHLNVSIRNGTICISVSDNGSGIPPEKLAELNRSIRDFKTARHSFGLPSINHRIALLYGENYGLTIESSPEKGTTVTIVIPDKNLIEGEI